jgi:hypothetical protein
MKTQVLKNKAKKNARRTAKSKAKKQAMRKEALKVMNTQTMPINKPFDLKQHASKEIIAMHKDYLNKLVDEQLTALSAQYLSTVSHKNTEHETTFIQSISNAMNHVETQRRNLDDSPFIAYEDFNEIPSEPLNLPEIEMPLKELLLINLNSLKHYYNKIVCEQYALNTVAQKNQLTNLSDALLCSVIVKPLMTHSYRMMTECETHYRCAVFLSNYEAAPLILIDMTITDYELAYFRALERFESQFQFQRAA